ncbi:MAG: DEAD/DEAH box helicase [Spirochaetes bacterium]|nr:DEAD/DEAH box helicase [Spirochaetota bacterium]
MKNSVFSTFDTMPIDKITKQAIEKMGFNEPTEIQKLVLPEAVKSTDILGQAQTGTGKTLAFGIPIIEKINKKRGLVQAIILTPTRELALQVSKELERLAYGSGIKIVSIYGGVPKESQSKALADGAQIVVGTPGRVLDLIKQKILNLNEVSIAVLDEADRMLDMGFYDDVTSILNKCSKHRQTMFFSATIPSNIQNLGRRYLKRPVIISTSDDNVLTDTTEHVFYEVLDNRRLTALCDVIDMESINIGIVFCKTKFEVDKVNKELRRLGYNVSCLHGDLTQGMREKVMKQYRGGSIDLLIATDIAARGIDVVGLSHVINYRIPSDAESFVHRTGRTGRAGAAGKSISFVSPGEYFDLLKIQEENSVSIKALKLPEAGEVLKRRVSKMIDEIKKNLYKEDIEQVYKEIKKKIPINKRGKALAYVLKKYIESGQRFLGTENKKSSDSPEEMKIFMNVGKLMGADPGNLKAFILKNVKISDKDIKRINIHDRFSFINTNKQSGEKIIKHIQKKTFNNKYSVMAELSREKPQRRGYTNRGANSGSRNVPRESSAGYKSRSTKNKEN